MYDHAPFASCTHPGPLQVEPSKLRKADSKPRSQRLSREVYALLYSDNKSGGGLTNPLVPTDTGSGYRQPRARLGRKHVRQWKRSEFTNSAREVKLIWIIALKVLWST